MVVEFGGEDLTKYLDDTGLGNHPDLIKTFIKMSDAVREDNKATANLKSSSPTSGVSTPQEARAALRELFKTKESRKNAYNPLDPNSKANNKKIMELANLAAMQT